MANKPIKREIKYLGKDFEVFRNELIEYSQTYFPTSYNDFSSSSPGMMLMELSAYVGDVLSFYLDNQFQETFLQYARQANNIYELAYMMGYKPKATAAATVDLDIYQLVPSINQSGIKNPDFTYSLVVGANSIVSSNTNTTKFLIEDPINFAVSNSLDPTEITVYESSGGEAVSFLLKKTRKAISATTQSIDFNFGAYTEFPTVAISDNNIIGILDVRDSNGNTWYEVDYLAQDVVFDSIQNANTNDPNFSINSSEVPYLLKLKQIQRRFATRFTSPTSLQIQFGAGNSADTDEEIIPNSNNVGLGLPFEKDKLTTAYSPTNFIFTNTYGIAPVNTTLTVTYLIGGGVSSNVNSNVLNSLSGNISFYNNNITSDANANTYFNSLQVNNPNAASGGGDGDSLIQIRQNAISNFSTQQRNVTPDDYLVRALSMPSKYGSISKAYVEKSKIINLLPGEIPSTLDLYILSKNNDRTLNYASAALKQNLQTYLSQFKVIGDSISIKDGFIINIGVNFEILTLPEYNNNEVIANCITALKDYFQIDNWQFNQPILLKELNVLIDNVEGVQTVENLEIINKVGSGYSAYAYDLEGARLNNVIYPSIDPMIFEVKNPNTDIQGKVVTL